MPSSAPDPPRLTAGRIEKNASTSYTSTGVTSPVSAGVYTWAGEYNGQMYFRRADGLFFIWCDPAANRWFMTALLGVMGVGWWQSPIGTIVGTYTAGGTYTGTPLVAIT
jgi:hypothetical protein